MTSPPELTSYKQQLSALEEVTLRGAKQVETGNADGELHDGALQELRAEMQCVQAQIEQQRSTAEEDTSGAELQRQPGRSVRRPARQ